MGVPPEIWGPNLWGTLHLLCLTGTISSNFVQEFANIIPCPACAGHFSELLKDNPFPDSNDPLVLFSWSVQVHNLVNARIGKPIFTQEQAMARWMTRGSHFDFKIPVIILLVLVLVFMLFKNKL